MMLQLLIRSIMIISILNLSFADVIFAEENYMRRSAEADITINTPGMVSTPLENINPTSVKKKEKGSKWMYYLLGGALIAGGAVAGMGGSTTSDNPEKPTTGTIVINGPAP